MLGLSHGNYMMIGSKGPSDALARSLETLIDPQNTNGVVILHSKMTRAVSVLAAHCTRSVRAANHQLGAKYLLTPASLYVVMEMSSLRGFHYSILNWRNQGEIWDG